MRLADAVAAVLCLQALAVLKSVVVENYMMRLVEREAMPAAALRGQEKAGTVAEPDNLIRAVLFIDRPVKQRRAALAVPGASAALILSIYNIFLPKQSLFLHLKFFR